MSKTTRDNQGYEYTMEPQIHVESADLIAST